MAAAAQPDFADGTVFSIVAGSQDLERLLRATNARHQLLLLDFSVKWCGPCRMLEPVLMQLAREHHGGSMVVAKMDCEHSHANQALAATERVSAYPTMKLYAPGQPVETLVGANVQALRAAISRHLACLGPPPKEGDLVLALAGALARVKAGCSFAEFLAAAKMLAAIVQNVVARPDEPKYRRIKTNNASYKTKLGSRAGGRECMEAIGFQERTEAMESILVLDDVPPGMGTVVAMLQGAIAEAERATASGSTPPAPSQQLLPAAAAASPSQPNASPAAAAPQPAAVPPAAAPGAPRSTITAVGAPQQPGAAPVTPQALASVLAKILIDSGITGKK